MDEAGEALADAHHMYVALCADGSWYTGYATDVERRIATHNAGRGARYTRLRGPVQLLAQAQFPTRHLALSAEYHFKLLSRAEKERLLVRARHASGVGPDEPPDPLVFADVLLDELDIQDA